MTDDSFPPFPFAKLDENAPPMPKEKKVKKAKSTNGRRRKVKRRAHKNTDSATEPLGRIPAEKASLAFPQRPTAREDALITVSVEDIKFINGVLQSMQAFPRKQQERIIVALAKVFG